MTRTSWTATAQPTRACLKHRSGVHAPRLDPAATTCASRLTPCYFAQVPMAWAGGSFTDSLDGTVTMRRTTLGAKQLRLESDLSPPITSLRRAELG